MIDFARGVLRFRLSSSHSLAAAAPKVIVSFNECFDFASSAGSTTTIIVSQQKKPSFSLRSPSISILQQLRSLVHAPPQPSSSSNINRFVRGILRFCSFSSSAVTPQSSFRTRNPSIPPLQQFHAPPRPGSSSSSYVTRICSPFSFLFPCPRLQFISLVLFSFTHLAAILRLEGD